MSNYLFRSWQAELSGYWKACRFALSAHLAAEPCQHIHPKNPYARVFIILPSRHPNQALHNLNPIQYKLLVDPPIHGPLDPQLLLPLPRYPHLSPCVSYQTYALLGAPPQWTTKRSPSLNTTLNTSPTKWTPSWLAPHYFYPAHARHSPFSHSNMSRLLLSFSAHVPHGAFLPTNSLALT